MRICCEASLKGLDVEYVDLYYQHHVDISVPMEVQVRSIRNCPAYKHQLKDEQQTTWRTEITVLVFFFFFFVVAMLVPGSHTHTSQ